MPTYDEYKGFLLNIFPPELLDTVTDWIQNSLTPDEVYRKEDLEEWALDNGFIKEEE